MSTPLLEIEDLTKSFGGVHAVRNCTFSVPEGQVVGLIGPNGAGKSTVVDLVSGFGRPDSGSVRFAGQSLAGRHPDVISRLGLIRTFQSPREWRSLSVMDNVLLASAGSAPSPSGARSPGPARSAAPSRRTGPPSGPSWTASSSWTCGTSLRHG